MKIAVDASQIIYSTGVSFYTSNLLKALSRIDKENEYLIFSSSLRAKDKLEKKLKELDLSTNFKFKTLGLPPSFFEFIWNKLQLGVVENFVGKVDVFHASDWTQPKSKKAKLITTIHDLAVLKYPDFFSSRILKNHKLKLEWIKKDKSLIIAVSNSTKKDIIKYLNIDSGRIKVIYEAIPYEHQIKIKDIDKKKIKEKYNLDKYFLFIGGLNPRKNLKRTARAFLKLFKKYKYLKLMVIGVRGEKHNNLAKDLNLPKNSLVYEDELSFKEFSSLYAGAIALVYPSLYEGFGLPVLEAMYHGCPVITSNISSLPEVAGDSALLVDPTKPDEIFRAIKNLLENNQLKQDLIKKGHVQVKKFSWQKTAKQTLNIYKSLITNH